MRGDEPDVGAARDELVSGVDVAECGHDRLTLRRPRGDRRSFYRERRTLEVDVVQFVSVDEPPTGHIADLGVVLPAVPQTTRSTLHVIRGFAEQFGGQRGTVLGEFASAEVLGGIPARGHLDPYPGAAGAHVVECRDGLGRMERLGVGGDDRGHQPDVSGARRDARGRSSTASRRPRTWSVRSSGRNG